MYFIYNIEFLYRLIAVYNNPGGILAYRLVELTFPPEEPLGDINWFNLYSSRLRIRFSG